MSERATDGEAPDGAEPDWVRRRRLAAVFGDVLPETTRDERLQGSPPTSDSAENWLREQVPPHHG